MYHRHNYRADIAGPTWLYRFYAGPQFVYVGVTSDPQKRFVSHRRKPWWVTVDRALLRWFPSREAAFAAEREAIRMEHPKQNIARPKVTD